MREKTNQTHSFSILRKRIVSNFFEISVTTLCLELLSKLMVVGARKAVATICDREDSWKERRW